MKLLQRTGRYYLLFSTLVFALWGIGLFLALSFVMNLETDEHLLDAKSVLHQQITDMDSIPLNIVILDNVIEIMPIHSFSNYEQFSDTLIWNAIEDEHELAYRKLTYHDKINGKPYRIALNHSKLDTEEMLTTIVITVLGILGLLLFTINIFNRSLSLNLWKPFYKTIQQIKTFSFEQKEPLSPPPSNIDEFSILHQAIHEMTSKVLSDYNSLKRFTGNASHEIQNPLAIIKSKVELLIQEKDLNENMRAAIQEIQTAASRLARLNHSLLLLTRIENRQYQKSAEINLKTLIENQLDFVEPLLFSKNLTIETDLETVYQLMEPNLAEVLINNLLGNAIKHNIQGGHLKIKLTASRLEIHNSGAVFTGSSAKLFERFHKEIETAPSLGLGLAIVKEICVSHGFEVAHAYQNEEHVVSVLFKNNS